MKIKITCIVVIIICMISCREKVYTIKVIIFDEPWCIQKGTPIFCDQKKIGEITNFYKKNNYYIGEAKFDTTFKMYYSIIPYIRTKGPKGCYIGFETKNGTFHKQTDTIFVTHNMMIYN